jgi:MFS family permease
MKRALYPLLAITFIGSFGLSVVIPFLVFLVNDYGGNPFVYGIMGATYPLFQLVGAPLLGKWSDQYGRKKILILSQAGTLISWIIFLYALYMPTHQLLDVHSSLMGDFSLTTPLLVLFLARAFDGLTGGNISVAYAYLADISDHRNRKAYYGKMSAASNVGFIAGPALAGLLASQFEGYVAPVLMASFIAVVGLIILFIWLPECSQKDNNEADDSGSLREIVRIRFVPFMFLLYFLIFLGFNFFYTAFPTHARDTLEWSSARLGIYMSILSLAMFLVQGPVMAKISRTFKEYQLIVAGSLILSFQFFMLIPGIDALTYGAILFFACGNGVMWPSYLSLLGSCGRRSQQGRIQGLGSSFGSLASIMGLLLGGFFYQTIGPFTFIIPGAVILLVFILSFRTRMIQSS